jgi:hypothetical protein
MTITISNNELAEHVTAHDVFRNSNETVYSVKRGDLYIVYSYGEHFPMYVYDFVACEWFGNKDRHSRTTSRHQTQARPDTDYITWFDTSEMKSLVDGGGYVAYCADRCADWDHIPF